MANKTRELITATSGGEGRDYRGSHCISVKGDRLGLDKIITHRDDSAQLNTLPEQADDTCLPCVIVVDTCDTEAITSEAAKTLQAKACKCTRRKAVVFAEIAHKIQTRPQKNRALRF